MMDKEILLMLISVVLGAAFPYLCRCLVSFVRSKTNDSLLQTFGLYTTVFDINGVPCQRYRYCQIRTGKSFQYNVVFGDSVETKRLGRVSIKKKSITHRGMGEFSHGSLQIKVNKVNNKLHMDEYFCFKTSENLPYYGLHLGYLPTLDTYCGVAILAKMGAYESIGIMDEHYKLFLDNDNSAIISSTAKIV